MILRDPISQITKSRRESGQENPEQALSLLAVSAQARDSVLRPTAGV